MSEPAHPPRDTLVAIATAQGAGGVGIVRLSGPRAIAIAEAMSAQFDQIVADAAGTA